MKSYDIAIVGAGMAGATLALAIDAFSHGKLKIALLEAKEVESQQASHPGYDSRAIALSHATVLLLKQIGLWDDFAVFATAITDIQVSDKGHLGTADISSTEQGVVALGYVVELADVGFLYQPKIQRSPNIDYYCPAQIKKIDRQIDKVLVTYETDIEPEQLETKLIVAADGALSQTCQLLNLETITHDFEQHAIIANVSTEQLPKGRAFERFTASGPLAFLPMREGRNSVVWSVSSRQVDELMQLSDADFGEALQNEFGWRLGRVTKIGARASYPLVLRYRPNIVSHRVAVVGNAAQALHPIAGQGFNLAIRDVVSLADEVVNALENRQDIGEYAVLSAYRLRRESDREQTIRLTSNLVHLFSNNLPLMRVGRNLGLLAFHHLPNLKRPVVRRTMGLVER